MKELLRIYHSLPYTIKVIMASGRGMVLRRWRFGRETERLIAEAVEREAWSPDRWRSYQEERLASLLHRAATLVPFYRGLWAERRRKGDRSSWDRLENWPVLEKEPLRDTPRLFLADDCRPRRMLHLHTSGSTGTPIDLWWSTETSRTWYALFEARWRRWNGVSLASRWAILGGQLVTAVGRSAPPFWVWNYAMNQLYMSAYHLSPRFIPYYLDALKEHRVEYLWGYTSSLFLLAQEALRSNRNDLTMAVVLTNAEPLLDHQRQVIGEAFQCPVRETYGMAEIVAGASECSAGHMHAWPEAGIVEVFDKEQPLPSGATGDLVCTGLLNKDMPLIRYRVGDSGKAPVSAGRCVCGRTLPLIPRIEGRSDDLILTLDGRRVGRLDPVFKGAFPVREAQIVQESPTLVRVRLVPAPGYDGETERSIRERLRDRLGDMNFVVEKTAEIPRGKNGKFRAVISRVRDVAPIQVRDHEP